MYSCIKQPTAWYSWVLTKNKFFEDVSITIFLKFVNKAVIKYVNIYAAQEGKFTGSGKNMTEDIVRMIADITHNQRLTSQSIRQSCPPSKNQTDKNSQAYGSEYMYLPKPPLCKHYK